MNIIVKPLHFLFRSKSKKSDLIPKYIFCDSITAVGIRFTLCVVMLVYTNNIRKSQKYKYYLRHIFIRRELCPIGATPAFKMKSDGYRLFCIVHV